MMDMPKEGDEGKGAPNSSGRGKKVLLVKRKKKFVKKASGSLPTFRQIRHPGGDPVNGARATTTTHAAATANGDDDSDDDYPFDSVLASLPNDCALAIQSLQQSPNMSIAIPFPSDPSHYILAVLELHLYRTLQDANAGDTVVSRELADLLASNKIRKLSSPSRQANPLQVVLFTSDYERAARGTIVVAQTTDDDDDSSPQQMSEASVEWLIRQLSFLKGHRIAQADLEERWKADPLPRMMMSLENVLETLTRQQLLLGSSLDRYYQLWLPTWGVVLQAWETARKKAVSLLKRSAYKERSMTTMQQRYSPIPTNLVLDWMESVAGQVEIVQRPAGKFVRLSVGTKNDDDNDE